MASAVRPTERQVEAPRPPRRGRLLGAAVAAVALALAITGCASRAATTAESDPSADSSAEGQFPVTVEHEYGELSLEQAPQRVVSVGFKEQDWLYQFGVSPVGVRSWYGFFDHEINPWVADLVEGEPPVVLGAELDFEEIAALQPDLIVGVYAGLSKKDYDKLSRIAPTLAGPVGVEPFNASWREMTTLIGATLGKSDQAEEIIDDTEARFAEARAEHPELEDAEVGAWSAWAVDSTGIYSSVDPRPQLLSELGLKTPPEADELTDGEFWASVSEELVGETIDTADDAVIVIGGSSSKEEPGARSVLLDNPTFSTSRNHSEGRVVFVDTKAADVAFSFVSPLSIQFTLDHLVDQLVAAVDGDPATEVPPSPDV